MRPKNGKMEEFKKFIVEFIKTRFWDQCILEKYIKGLLTKEAALAHMTDASIIAQLNQHWATEQAKLLGGNQ